MLSVVILTFNSEKYLREVLQSVAWADEIVVVDSGSNDGTRAICAEFANLRFIYQKWLGFGAQKQFGVDKARGEWIFVLDSDEVMTQPLQNEIKAVLKSPQFCAYKVARLNYFFGRTVRNLGLYPDFSLRLFHREFAQFDGREIHEKVVLKFKPDSATGAVNSDSGADCGLNSAKNSHGANSNEREICLSSKYSAANSGVGTSNSNPSADCGLNLADLTSRAVSQKPVNSSYLQCKSANLALNSSVGAVEFNVGASNWGTGADRELNSGVGANGSNSSPKPRQIAVGTLENHFIHYAYESVEQFIAKQNRYSSLGAKKSKFKAIFSPAWTFFKLFALKGGWREGWRGYVIARLYAQYTFWKYVK